MLNTPYPEKIVLAFYASTCGSTDASFCRNKKVGWTPQEFLVRYAEEDSRESAWKELDNGNPQYFNLPGFSGNQNIFIDEIRYYPAVEARTTESTYTGAKPQGNCVVLELVNSRVGEPGEQLAYGMRQVEGQWKIERRMPLDQCLNTRFDFVPTPTPDPTPAPNVPLEPTEVPVSSENRS